MIPSVFPELYNYSRLAPFLLRIILGFVVIKYGYQGISASRIIGGAMLVSGLLLLVGLFTQPAAIVVIAVLVFVEFFKTGGINSIKPCSKTITILMIAVAISLLFLGPGILSFDFPL